MRAAQIQYPERRGVLPERFPSYPDTRQTATLELTSTTGVAIDATSGSLLYMTLQPSPVWPVWISARSLVAEWTGQCYPASGDADYLVAADQPLTWRPTSYVALSGNYTTPVVGHVQKQPFLYAPDGRATVQVTFSNASTANSEVVFTLRYRYLSDAGLVQVETVNFSLSITAGSASTEKTTYMSFAHWFYPESVTFTQFGAVPGTLADPTPPLLDSINVIFNVRSDPLISKTSMLPLHDSPIAFADSKEPYESTRVNASSLTLHNITALTSKEGQVVAMRASQEKVPFYKAPFVTTASVPAQLRYTGALENGVRTFTLPPTIRDSFIDCVVDVGQLLAIPAYPLEMRGQYCALQLFDASTATATMLSAVYHQHLEFCPQSQLFNLGVSRYTLDNLVRVLQQVSQASVAEPVAGGTPAARLARVAATADYGSQPRRRGKRGGGGKKQKKPEKKMEGKKKKKEPEAKGGKKTQPKAPNVTVNIQPQTGRQQTAKPSGGKGTGVWLGRGRPWNY